MASLIPVTPDINQRALSNAMSNYVSSVDSVNKALMMPVSILNSQVDYNDEQKKRAEEKYRYGIEQEYKQRQEQRLIDEATRKNQEQKAADVYYGELAKGTQYNSGGMNIPELIAESNKYDLTPQEIEASKGIVSSADARAKGLNSIADKMAWQENVSSFSGSDVLRESRPDMYERAMNSVLGQGLPVLGGMVDKLDATRLAQKEAEAKKIEDIDKRLAELGKDDTSNLKWAIGQQGSVGQAPTYDENGSVTGYTTISKRSMSLDDKYDSKVADGEKTILESVSKLKVKDSANSGKDALALYKEIIKSDPTIDPKSAAEAVSQGIGTKESKWYIPFDEDTGTFKRDTVDKLLPQLKGTVSPENSAVSSGQVDRKGKLAEDFATLTAAQNSAEKNKLLSERAALSKTPEERSKDVLLNAMKREGIIAQDKPIVTADNKESQSISGLSTKIPESLIKAEGVKTEPYKDSKGIVTVGVGYAFNKSRSEIERDFKDAGIPIAKIDGLMKQDGTKLTNEEVSNLTNVSYDRDGVRKLKGIGIDISKLDPTLAEIGVIQAYRGDIVKDGKGYRGELYKYLKNNDLDGMKKYVETTKGLPKEVKTRMELTTNREGPITEEQYKYNMANNKSSKTDWSKFSDNEIADIRNSLNPNNPVDKSILDDISSDRKIDYKSEAAKLKAQMDSLNSKGINTNEDILKFKDAQERYNYVLNKDAEEGKKEMLSSNLFELMGVVPKRDKSPRYSLGKDDNAAQIEEGLGDMTATMLPWGKLAEPVMPIVGKTVGYVKGALFPAKREELLQLPNFGTKTEWVNPNTIVATNKMEGVGAKKVIEGSSPRGGEVDRAIGLAKQASEDLKNTVPTNISNLDHFGALPASLVKEANKKMKKEVKKYETEAIKAELKTNDKVWDMYQSNIKSGKSPYSGMTKQEQEIAAILRSKEKEKLELLKRLRN